MPKTILIVDDDNTVRRVVGMFIKQLHPDAVVVHAENGAEGWEIINAPDKNFDLVISDVDMPVMNGVELTGKIRKDYPEVHIILISGNPEPTEHDADIFLQKPVGADDLFSTIRRLMAKQQ